MLFNCAGINAERHDPYVTITLTDPVNDHNFGSCDVYEALSNSVYNTGTFLGTIDTPTGSITVEVRKTIYGVTCFFYGDVVTIPWQEDTTGGVTLSGIDPSFAVLYQVTGNGTATISGVDYGG